MFPSMFPAVILYGMADTELGMLYQQVRSNGSNGVRLQPILDPSLIQFSYLIESENLISDM